MPHLIAEKDDLSAARILLLRKSASHKRCYAEHWKHARSKPRSIDPSRFARAGEFVIGWLVSAQAGITVHVPRVVAEPCSRCLRRATAEISTLQHIALRHKPARVWKR